MVKLAWKFLFAAAFSLLDSAAAHGAAVLQDGEFQANARKSKLDTDPLTGEEA